MKTQDVVDALVAMGLGDAKFIQGAISSMPAGDYVELINKLNSTNPTLAKRGVVDMLKKYGVVVAESDNYLEAMFSKFQEGTENVDHAMLGEVLKPISESTAPDARHLALEGYNYFMQLEDAHHGEALMDWLDENKVEYITDGKGQFHIKCGDRESAYRVGKTATGLVSRKKVVRDDVNEGKSAKKREAEAKAKIADIKPRNQDLLALSQRGGKGAHKVDPRKDDKFDRKAKHKKSPVEESTELSIDNQVSEADLSSRLEEGVLGMKPLSPIMRLRELAGMAPAPAVAPEMDDLSDITVDHDDSGFNDPLAAGEVGAEPADAEAGALAAGPVDMEDPFLAGSGDDMGAPVDAPLDAPLDPLAGGMGAPEMGGVPGDLPPMGMEAPLMAEPTQSDAMSHIEDCLNDIQGKLAEIRLAEYKSLVQKLTSLTQQVQTMGRDYLGEARKKK